MPNKLYKMDFSPPARLAWLAAKIYNVPTELVDVDLSKAEQFDPEFLKVNKREASRTKVKEKHYPYSSQVMNELRLNQVMQ